MIEGNFFATMFYADIEGHPDERRVRLAMEEVGTLGTDGEDPVQLGGVVRRRQARPALRLPRTALLRPGGHRDPRPGPLLPPVR